MTSVRRWAFLLVAVASLVLLAWVLRPTVSPVVPHEVVASSPAPSGPGSRRVQVARPRPVPPPADPSDPDPAPAVEEPWPPPPPAGGEIDTQAWSQAVTELVDLCVPHAEVATPGTGVRLSLAITPDDGAVEVAMDLFGDVVAVDGVQDCLDDAAWELDWPSLEAARTITLDLVFAGDAIPEGPAPIPQPAPVVRLDELPADVQRAIREHVEQQP